MSTPSNASDTTHHPQSDQSGSTGRSEKSETPTQAPGRRARFEAWLRVPENRRLAVLITRAALVLLAVLATVIVVSRMAGIEGEGGVAELVGRFKDTAWAPFIVVAIYILLNFAGVPQFLLVGGTVVIFGPTIGFLYSWVATMASSTVGYIMGHLFGGEILRRFAGQRVNAFSERIGRHGIAASFIVRFIPAGPALMVNMAAGVSHIAYWKFLIGTGVGVGIKIAVVTLVSAGLLQFGERGNPLVLGVVIGSLLLWVGAMWAARRYYRRWRERQKLGPAPDAPDQAMDTVSPEA